MRYLSGVKIQPPKNPLRNLAKISSSERFPMSFLDKRIERLSATIICFRGLTVLWIEEERAAVGDRVSVVVMVRVFEADRG